MQRGAEGFQLACNVRGLGSGCHTFKGPLGVAALYFRHSASRRSVSSQMGALFTPGALASTCEIGQVVSSCAATGRAS